MVAAATRRRRATIDRSFFGRLVLSGPFLSLGFFHHKALQHALVRRFAPLFVRGHEVSARGFGGFVELSQPRRLGFFVGLALLLWKQRPKRHTENENNKDE